MQSAAVLPTESPVKSLPEILGVPLQRKTFFSPVLPLLLSMISLETGWRAQPVLRGFDCRERGLVPATRARLGSLSLSRTPLMCHA